MSDGELGVDFGTTSTVAVVRVDDPGDDVLQLGDADVDGAERLVDRRVGGWRIAARDASEIGSPPAVTLAP